VIKETPERNILKRAIHEGYAAAKFWQNAAIVVQVIIFGLGVLALFWPTFSPSYAPVALIVAAILAAIKMRASFLKGEAESNKRVHEYHDSFGGEVPKSLLTDLEASTSETIPAQKIAELDKGLEFASTSAPGERRALENVQESAWWSKIGARCTRNILLAIFIVVAVGSIALLVAVTLHSDHAAIQTQAATGKIVAATLLCIFSLNLLPGIWGFHRFATKAQEVDADCERKLSKAEITPLEAFRLMTEYQMSRASSPLIPTFIWNFKKVKLNRAWDRHKRSKS
jgi:hypothetical protein